MLLVSFLRVDDKKKFIISQRIKIFYFNYCHTILVERISSSFHFHFNEKINNLSIFLKVWSTNIINLLFLSRAVVLDLYFFEKAVLLYSCFLFSKKSMLSLSGYMSTKFGTSNHKTYCWYVFITFYQYTVSWAFQINLYFTVNQRPIERSQKLLRHLCEIVTCVFKGGIGSCCSLLGS